MRNLWRIWTGNVDANGKPTTFPWSALAGIVLSISALVAINIWIALH